MPPRIPPPNPEILRDMIDADMSIMQIAAALGVSDFTLKSWLRAAGLHTHGVTGRPRSIKQPIRQAISSLTPSSDALRWVSPFSGANHD